MIARSPVPRTSTITGTQKCTSVRMERNTEGLKDASRRFGTIG